MARINLLPRETIQKRRFERTTKFVVSGGAVLVLALLAVWAVLGIQVSLRNSELQERQQLETDLRAEAETYRVFEENEAELNQRLELAEQALRARVEWGRLANELSLVIPADVWLESLSCGEEAGVTIFARAEDSPADVPDLAHKSVAKTLVRLADLEQLTSVWLDSSVKAEYEEQPVIEFSISAVVVRPQLLETESGVPAPPTPGTGQ